jgi:PIN domain nuclease of toxin-antitoxin system
MNYLLDTHLVVWSITQSPRLSVDVKTLLEDPANQPYASVISIWEVAIKHSLRRPDFTIDPHNLRRAIRQTDFRELPVLGEHAIAVHSLPKIHRDPFDRMLIAQAIVEGITLLTVDSVLAQYPGPVRLV